MENEDLKAVIESIIFAADSPVSLSRIAKIIEGEEREAVKAALTSLVDEYRARAGGIFIEDVAGGYVFRTNPENSAWIRRLFKVGPQRISRPAMETMAIIAYNQPVTRAEIEAVRGVDSAGVLATLLEKRFIKIVGRKETPGRPVVYGTTKEFLETFDLKDLSCLPSLREIQSTEEDDALEGPEEGCAGGEAAGGEDPGEIENPPQSPPEEETGEGAGLGPPPADAEASEDNSDGRGGLEA